MAIFDTSSLRFLVRGGLLAALKAATGVDLRPLARELTIATDTLSLRVGNGASEYAALSVLNPVAPSFQFKTDTGSTADSDPGNGLFKWNNATQASATVLYFDNVTNGTGTDLSTFFTSIAPSGFGFIHIVLEEDRTKWQLWKWTAVTSASGYWKFTVVLQASTASLGDDLPVRVTFTPMGTSGDGGGVGSIVRTTKLTDEARASTTTATADSTLQAVLSNGHKYRVKFWMIVNQANATMDLKIGSVFTGTVSTFRGVHKGQNPGSTVAYGVGGVTNFLTPAAFTSTVAGTWVLEWEYIVDVSASGTLSVNWAQNTSDAANLTMYMGSYVEVEQLT